MNNTAKKIKNAADTVAEGAVSKAKDGLHAAGEGLHAAGDAAMKAGQPKRSPMKVTLLTILGAAVIGAIVYFWRTKND